MKFSYESWHFQNDKSTVTDDNFSEETLAAINEARRSSKDSRVKSYASARELFADCE